MVPAMNKVNLVDWKTFFFDPVYLAIHIPTSHLIEVEVDVYEFLNGKNPSEEIDAQLAEISNQWPRPRTQPRKTDIHAISLNMAQGCNLRCTYCFAGEGDYGKKSMMSAETAIRAISQLSMGKPNFHVIFFGGEPLLNYKVIKEVVEWCSQQDVNYTYAMTTNGTLLSADKLDFFNEHRFAITISYDGKGLQGVQRKMHDNKTSSEPVVTKKLKVFQEKLGLLQKVILRSTITKENLDQLFDSVISTLTSHNYKLAVSSHTTDLQRLSFNEADVDKLGEVLEKVVAYFVEQQDFETLMKLDNVKKHIQIIHNGEVNQIACGAGVNYLTVSTSGSYFLCHRFNEDKTENYGSIDNGLNSEKLQQVLEFRKAKKEPCRSCWMREWCAGGCFHNHKMAKKDKFDVDPLFCKLQEIEMNTAIYIYKLLQDHRPDLLDRI